MGFFLASRDDAPRPPAAWWVAHARQGFDRIETLVAPGWRIAVAGKLNGLGPHVVRRPNGDFAACCGYFAYRGRAFEPALDALLDDFDPARFPWRDCRGHFAVILRRGGRAWIAGDELGAYKLYRDADSRSVSSSFSAIRASLDHVAADTQGVYEYALNGAPFGDRTFIAQVRQLRSGALVGLSDRADVVATATPLGVEPLVVGRSLDAVAEQCAARLRALFSSYAAHGGSFRTALSGGYDSRLMLALLLDANVDPALYVYGENGDDDVRIAAEIAAGEGLRLEHVDKRRRAPVSPGVAEQVERAWARFDAWKNDGLFDNGADADDRLQRAPAGTFVLNGSVGECFRNFFHLPDGRYRLEDIVSSFYWRVDPRELTPRFVGDDYRDAIVAAMRESLPGAPQSRLHARPVIESLYPLFRARYWTGRDVGINQRFGPALFPFMEPAIFDGTQAIPLAMKDYGRLESRIIAMIRPSLARYRTAYGFAPADGPPLRYRLAMQFSLRRPPWLRRLSYRVHRRTAAARGRPAWMHAALAAARLDPSLPAMSEYFNVGEIRSADVFNRVATMELVLRDAVPRIAGTDDAPLQPSQPR